ncbi:helix-turn-helix domain-containing protein [Streptomyces clavuligerus]|uniref:helix-turn-helix domain-containing protein n=1 Tax=Streptomyces clavuligerus TaxID=1901 RepID=UPI0022B115D3|nr:helix-turn-helix transcriptional regulator [Streptomyces clavuligerus]
MLRGPASTATLRGLLDETTAPEARVQLTAALAHGLYVQGRWADALAALDRAERTGAADAAWAPLFQGLRATIHHGAGHSERCAVLARQVIADARSGRHPFGEAYGRHALSCALLRDRRTEAALAENTLALRAAARVDRTGARWLTCTLTDLRVTMLLYRAVMLGLVDRPEEARSALDRARDETAGRATADQLGGITVTAALLDYTTGRWDDALARLDRQPDPVDPWLPSLRHSVAALVHGHRDRGADARAHCEAAAGRTTPCGSHSNRGGYPLMARALLAERSGRPHEALAVLLPTLDPGYARDLDQRFQWMPDIVRLALRTGDGATARAAAVISAGEADREHHPARTAAAARCRGLVDADPGPLAEAVAYYRGVARPLDLGQALEDGAAVRAALGEPAAARELLQQALERYARLGAAWDARRAVGRLRALGVRTGPRAARNGRPSTGWAALTPAELRVAHRVAQGRSNPEIAAELFLSPRTVQTHVSSILTKLGARSRTEVARQAAERSSQHP